MKNTKLTSVKIIESLYNKFKRQSIGTEMTFQKLANRYIHLYLKYNDFREILETEDTLNTVSGSRF